MRLVTVVSTFHGLNCFGHVIYVLQMSMYQNIAKLLTPPCKIQSDERKLTKKCLSVLITKARIEFFQIKDKNSPRRICFFYSPLIAISKIFFV